MIRILRSTVALLGAVTLVGGLVGQGRAAADGGPTPPAIQTAGDHFETYDHDYGRYSCRCRYEREFRGGYQCYDGYYHPYDDRYYYHDGCRRYYYDDRYYDDRYYYDRYYYDRYHHGDHDGDHDGDRDFPDRRRGRNHGDD